MKALFVFICFYLFFLKICKSIESIWRFHPLNMIQHDSKHKFYPRFWWWSFFFIGFRPELVSKYKPTTYLSVHSGTLGSWDADLSLESRIIQTPPLVVMKDFSTCRKLYQKDVWHTCIFKIVFKCQVWWIFLKLMSWCLIFWTNRFKLGGPWALTHWIAHSIRM